MYKSKGGPQGQGRKFLEEVALKRAARTQAVLKAQKKAKKRQQKRNKAEKPVLVQEAAPAPVISDVKALVLAEGVRVNIELDTPIDQNSFEFLPVGLVSLAMVRSLDEPYLFYLGNYNDIYDIATGGTGTATNRLRFQNDLYMALAPKTIPFRNDGIVAYKFTKMATTTPPPVLNLDGGLFYYMYEDAGGTFLGVWRRQQPPSGPINEQTINDAYLKAENLLSDKVKHLQLQRNVGLSKRYAKDASAFARMLSYYGQGAGIGSPNSSIELEVPFSSRLLGTLQPFDPTIPRSSRYLAYTSGDSISNWSLGALPEFPTSFYNGALAPIYKFLDLTEVVHALLSMYISAIQSFVSSTPNLTTEEITRITSGFGCTYTQFFIMVRQQVLYMFRDSQCVGQGLTFSRLNTGFRPFICGSNTYPRTPITILTIPAVLNENLRCLKMAIRPYVTKQFSSNKNHITHIPVWGTFGGFVPLQYQMTIDGVAINLFQNENSDPNTPSVFDGTSGGTAVDFNTTPVIATIAQVWNEDMIMLKNQISHPVSMGGDAKSGPFLQFTRYCAFNSGNFERDVSMIRRIPTYMKPFVKEVETEERIVKRVNSKENVTTRKTKKVYAPPGSTIFSEYTVAYSGMIPITATHKENFCNIILPIVEVTFPMSSIPNVTQVQTAAIEPYILDLQGVGIIQGDRASELSNASINYLKGIAGDGSELASYVDTLNKMNEGGFLGDLFAAIVEPLVSDVPIIGGVAKMAGNMLRNM
jgi:hypothetical protein